MSYHAVDAAWLAGVRRKNREAYGMEGMPEEGMGAGSQDLVDSLRATKAERAPQSSPGSAAELVNLLGPVLQAPPPSAPPMPTWVPWAAGALAVTFLGVIVYAAVRR